MKKKIVFLPYDMDTALGINNEGSLTFDYGLEDVDQVNGADVFNGQQSVLWNNLRDAFGDEIKAMYQTLRANGILSYANVENRFETHQSKWPETIFNEDAKYKYIDPLTEDGNSSYLGMLLGSKTEQRKWWLYNRFRYMDSKWNAGDALSDIITIRGYAKSNITLTPYADIYPSIKFGSYLVQQRGQRGQSYTIVCPLDNLDDTEIYIYSASQLADIGDISGLLPGYCDFSNAIRLQHLVIGSAASGYSNPKLEHLTVGNLPLLLDIDVRNCPNLAETVDLSGCVNLETIRFTGTAITGVQLANGGAVKTLQLPASITNLTLRNLKQLSSLSVAGYSNITTLWLEGNSSAVNTRTIFDAISTGARVRILGIQWSVTSNTASFISKLEGMRGIDESGNNTQYAQLSGSIYFSTISGTQLQTLRDHYPNVTVSYGTLKYSVDMYSEDGTTLLKSNEVSSGGTCPSYTPTKASTAQYTYSFAGWATSPGGSVVSGVLNNIQSDKQLYAVFNSTLRTYTVYFYNESTLLQTVNNVPYGGTANYTGSEPTKEGYEFSGWSPSNSNITGQTSCYAQFETVQAEIVEITDSWATIFANIDNGTYKTVYKVGNYKPLDFGSEGTLNMQIAAFDKDELSSGNGYAPISWVPMGALKTGHKMRDKSLTAITDENNATIGYEDNTGTLGGYETTTMHTYCNEDVYAMIPAEVRSRILEVKKYSYSYYVSETSPYYVSANNVVTNEKVWILSRREVFGSTETMGPKYSTIFPDANSRKRIKYGATSASSWWERSAYDQSLFRYVSNNGYNTNYDPAYESGVCPCFCT